VLFDVEGRLIRWIHQDALCHYDASMRSSVCRSWIDAQRLIPSLSLEQKAEESVRKQLEGRLLSGAREFGRLIEHPRIPFVSYPQEWAPEMLFQAGMLTIDLALELVEEGLGLKDATPNNVLFQGSKPVFVDILSFEQRNPTDPLWLPLNQFYRLFINPLVVHRYFHLPIAPLMTTMDGVTPEHLYGLCSPFQRFRSPFLALATLPTLLGRRTDRAPKKVFRPHSAPSADQARFTLQFLLKRARRKLEAMRPRRTRSHWSRYMEHTLPYSEEDQRQREEFVARSLERIRPKRVLDVGCNTGVFSLLACNAGASVVAIDSDPDVVGEVWSEAHARSLDVLPLVVNIAKPTPAIGWKNQETQSFLKRAGGKFDAVFFLAVIHHLQATEAIPLGEIVSLAADLTSDYAIIEFVSEADEMFQVLARGRRYPDASRPEFERCVRVLFDICDQKTLKGGLRELYSLKKRGLS
jgi:SAM-dependent methyltransferase